LLKEMGGGGGRKRRLKFARALLSREMIYFCKKKGRMDGWDFSRW